MITACPTNSGVCAVGARQPVGAQAPTAQPHQEGVTETWVSVEMGVSKTVPPASTREETSSLQERLLLRLLKVVTQPATAEQMARLGNDRVPVLALEWFSD